jgi:uncharacterized protein
LSDLDAEFQLSIVGNLDQIQADRWNALAGRQNPFVRHEFLRALETGECVGDSTGWYPRHALLERDGELVGAMPMYIKTNSYGEFVFDWAFADAYERHGLSYYPKLVVAVPFTPATGPRLLLGDVPAERERVSAALVNGALAFARQEDISSVHWLFPPEEQQQLLTDAGLLQRTGYQFHWTNPGYRDFQDFLDCLTHKRRKEIRRERRDVESAGLEIEVLWGRDAEERHWHAFHQFYCAIYDRKWGFPTLTLDFFLTLGEQMPDEALLILASNSGRYVAGTYSVCGEDTLFGRTWGCTEQHRGLHFELCYYQHIELAIARGLRQLEAGAQGEHKVSRGFLPTPTFSAHWFAHPSFNRAIGEFVDNEACDVASYISASAAHSPFKEGAREAIEQSRRNG